jgi:hypothetical protein
VKIEIVITRTLPRSLRWEEYPIDFSGDESIRAAKTYRGACSWVRANSRHDPGATYRIDVDGQAIAYYVDGRKVKA